MKQKKTLVLGASENPSRYSFMAVEKLIRYGHPVVAIGKKAADGTVEVRVYAGNPGRSSFEISQENRRTDDPDTIYAAGGARVVWVDHDTGKSMPLPEDVRALITT